MRSSHNNPYTGYTIDDWNWEFLKRNTRYRRLYKAVQRFKGWLDKKGFAPVASFTVFGRPFQFERNDRGYGWEWRYKPNGKKPIYLNDFSSPDNPSSRRYKGKLIKKLKPVTQIDGSLDRHGHGWTPAILQDHEIAIQIDTRFKSEEILCSLKNILTTIQPNKKPHLEKYKDYLRVWDLRQQKVTQKEIAEIVWRDEYKIKGGENYLGEKNVLLQRASDHEKAAQKLIEASFPPKKRSPKIKK
jgi:hypothetical protein